jgi:hypothetical protein
VLERDFTLSGYTQLCQAILAANYTIWPIAKYLTCYEYPRRLVLLRHDVDRRPETALRMARLENEAGIHSTYYFRSVGGVFNPVIIKQISGLGHEIGYHYETLSKTHGDHEAAIKLFEQELNQFREICKVETISMHGSPLSPFDNRELWKSYDFRKYGLVGEAYLSLDFEKLAYITDTGRSWGDNSYNLRDKVNQKKMETPLHSTMDLIQAFNNQAFSHICITAHPNRWSHTNSEWLFNFTSDGLINQAKLIIRLLRGN